MYVLWDQAVFRLEGVQGGGAASRTAAVREQKGR